MAAQWFDMGAKAIGGCCQIGPSVITGIREIILAFLMGFSLVLLHVIDCSIIQRHENTVVSRTCAAATISSWMLEVGVLEKSQCLALHVLNVINDIPHNSFKTRRSCE
jgi:hypothetical protein